MSPGLAAGGCLLTSGKSHSSLSPSSLFIQTGTPGHEMVWPTDRADLLSLTHNPDPHRHTQTNALAGLSVAWPCQVGIQNWPCQKVSRALGRKGGGERTSKVTLENTAMKVGERGGNPEQKLGRQVTTAALWGKLISRTQT